MNKISLLIFIISHVYRDVTALNYKPWKYNGTTPNITNVLIGRCLEYQTISSQNRNPALYIQANCNELANLFINSFSYKDSCANEINETSYTELFKIINNKKLLNNQAVFWSGTKEIVHDYSHIKGEVYTLEDTFLGYLANSLSWCGCKYSQKYCTEGVNYDKCNNSCPAVMDSYWSLASRTFAENANGTAFVMVNGTSGNNLTAYYRKSYFGRVELPTLGALKRVERLIVLVVFDLDTNPKEKCGTGTLVDLVSDAKKFGIKNVECKDDPIDTEFLLCAKYPHARECTAKSNADRPTWKSVSFVLIGLYVIFSAAVFA